MKKLTNTQKNWLLSIHLFLAAIWLGTMLSILVLSIAIAGMKDSESIHTTYEVMKTLFISLIPFAGPGSAITGLLLAALTHWGLARFSWIITKELLTVLSGSLSIFGLSYLINQAVIISAEKSIEGITSPTYTVNETILLIGIVFQIVSLTSILIIAVLKPGRQIKPLSLRIFKREMQKI